MPNSDTLEIQVVLYGQLADIAGKDELQFGNLSSTDQLREKLYQEFPAFKSLTFKIAVDKKIIESDTAISASSKIALLPPFSGG